MREMAFCANCGKQLPDGSAFCDGCGASQGVAAPPVQPQPAMPPQQPGTQQVPPPQQPMPMAYPPQAAYSAPVPRKSRGPLIAVVAVALVALLAVGGWWFFMRPMSEDEYKSAVKSALEDLDKAAGEMEANEPDDIETAREVIGKTESDVSRAAKKVKGLRPPSSYKDSHKELSDAFSAMAEAYATFANAANDAGDMEELFTLLEDRLGDTTRFDDASEVILAAADEFGAEVDYIY